MPLAILQIDTERGWRGGQRQTFLVARELARLGHRSLIACRAEEPLAQRAAAAGLRVVSTRPRSELALGAAFALRRLIVREQIQIVHAQSAHALALAALATIGTRARVVVTRHLAVPLRANPGTRWKYGRASAIIAVSRAAAEALLSSGIAPEEVQVVHGGVELQRAITPASAERLQQFGIPPNARWAVMVGALVEQKDPLTFVRAIAAARAKVPDLHALVLGEGELRGAIEREVRALGLTAAIHLAGFREVVDALLAAASVAVLSSRFEGLPLTIMDAFVLNVPVAATAGPGIPELVLDGETGLLVPVGDAQALGDAIARIVSDQSLAEGLVRSAGRRATELSIEHTVQETIAIYERVLEDPGDRTEETSRRTEAAIRASSDSSMRAP